MQLGNFFLSLFSTKNYHIKWAHRNVPVYKQPAKFPRWDYRAVLCLSKLNRKYNLAEFTSNSNKVLHLYCTYHFKISTQVSLKNNYSVEIKLFKKVYCNFWLERQFCNYLENLNCFGKGIQQIIIKTEVISCISNIYFMIWIFLYFFKMCALSCQNIIQIYLKDHKCQ